MARVALIEGFYGGSHKQWADGLIQHSAHDIDLFSLSAHHWKWRMHGGAISLAQKYLSSTQKYDLIIATDMIDLSLFLASIRERDSTIPAVLYFHENQLAYPWNREDDRDRRYAWINYSSALTATQCWYNSEYNRSSFLRGLDRYLSAFPKPTTIDQLARIEAKSEVVPLGISYDSLHMEQSDDRSGDAVILWNHRWEHDKNPEEFFQALRTLIHRGIGYKVILIGEQGSIIPGCFSEFKKDYPERIIQYGYVESRQEYACCLHRSDILPVCSYHDFFGISIAEAVYCDVIPLLPRRLVYPEIFPEPWQQRAFFYDDGELVDRLQRCILDVRLLRKQSVRASVEAYCWEQRIEDYDVRIRCLATG